MGDHLLSSLLAPKSTLLGALSPASQDLGIQDTNQLLGLLGAASPACNDLGLQNTNHLLGLLGAVSPTCNGLGLQDANQTLGWLEALSPACQDLGLGAFSQSENALTHSLASISGLMNYTPPVSYTPIKWIAVRQRFEQFHQNLALTVSQRADGNAKRHGVVSSLNRAYYNTNSETDNSFFVGSWAKNTAIRPPSDVDLYFLLPPAVYHRFQGHVTARQSALLQEVKSKLAITFPNTKMRGDGQVVMVNFGTYCVEVVPAFALTTEGRYWICNTGNGGTYKETAPWDEVNYLERVNGGNAGNLLPLIRMLKAWQATCSVPLKSFQIELIAADFIQQSQWRFQNFFWFDWMARDFFVYLQSCANSFVFVPGTFEAIWLGNEWLSKAQAAYSQAVNACKYEALNMVDQAGEEWQKIFGPSIPRTV